jgi:hypothetical protein
MKIHIDTADEKEKAQAKNIAKKPAPAAKSTSNANTTTQAKPNLPKSPPKEPKAPKDVAAARGRQTDVLKQRQQRELAGQSDTFHQQGGTGYWPSPFL